MTDDTIHFVDDFVVVLEFISTKQLNVIILIYYHVSKCLMPSNMVYVMFLEHGYQSRYEADFRTK